MQCSTPPTTTLDTQKTDAWAKDILARYEKLKAEAQRLAAMICPAEVCRSCGATKRLQRHHINGRRLDNRRINLTILCHACHNGLHYAARRKEARHLAPLSGVWAINEALGVSDVHVRA